QLAKWRNTGMRPCRFPESFVAQVKPATFQPGPRDTSPAEPLGKPVGLERAPFVNTVIGVDNSDKLILNVEPVAFHRLQRHRIDRDAGPFDARCGGHIAAAKQRPRKIDRWQHCGQEPRQTRNVALAVIENRGALLWRPGAAPHNESAHFLLLASTDRI